MFYYKNYNIIMSPCQQLTLQHFISNTFCMICALITNIFQSVTCEKYGNKTGMYILKTTICCILDPQSYNNICDEDSIQS